MKTEVDILSILPQRYPFLMIDRVLEVQDGQSVVALKNISYNEPILQGHFPDAAVMPVVLILEAIAQSTAFFLHKEVDVNRLFFASVDKAKFHGFVRPGDTLIIRTEKTLQSDPFIRVRGKVYVGDELMVQADLTMVIVDESPLKKVVNQI